VSDVRIVFRKYGGALHWNHAATKLGEDEHGIWVVVPGGTVARKGDGPPVTWENTCLMLFPPDAWWTATFHLPPHKAEVYVDVTTVPQWQDGEVSMVDLDLDVIRMRDGRLILDDEDEFAEHQVALGYPPEVISQAEETAQWLMKEVGQRQGVFGGAHLRWLAQ
jgi:uncharacterized protein